MRSGNRRLQQHVDDAQQLVEVERLVENTLAARDDRRQRVRPEVTFGERGAEQHRDAARPGRRCELAGDLEPGWPVMEGDVEDDRIRGNPVDPLQHALALTQGRDLATALDRQQLAHEQQEIG
jgi:hypothetical protein